MTSVLRHRVAFSGHSDIGLGQSSLRYALGMSIPSELHETDPVVVPIAEAFEMSMDEWLADLRDGEPLILSVSTAELLADARAESE